MDQNSQDPPTPTPGDVASGDVRARAVAFYEQAADIHGIAMPIAAARGTTVRLDDIHRLDDGRVSVTTEDGATTVIDAETVAARRAEWTTEDKLASAITFIRAQDTGRRSVQLARRLGRDTAHVPYFYRDEAGGQRTGSKQVTLAPRRASAGRRVGRAARPATNHRSAGSRRTAASSSTAGSDPGDPDPPGSHRLAPSPRAAFAYEALTAKQRGAVVA